MGKCHDSLIGKIYSDFMESTMDLGSELTWPFISASPQVLQTASSACGRAAGLRTQYLVQRHKRQCPIS
jgi:hypothetical protein